MAAASAHADSKFSSRRLRTLIVGAALLIATIAAANVLVLVQSHENTLHEVQEALLRQSLTLSELVDHTFQSADLVLADVAQKVRRSVSTGGDLLPLTTQQFHSLLKEEKSQLPQIDALGLLDSEGIRLNNSRDWPSPHVDLSSREYFEALRADPKIKSFISQPVEGAVSGKWVVILARPVLTDDGHLLGVVFASTVLNYFEDLFRSTSLGDGYAATLVRQDGTLLARFPMAGTIGKIVPASVLKKIANSRFGLSRSVSPVDQQPRIAAAYRLANYPLTVIVTQNEDVAFGSWRRTALTMMMVTSAIIVLIIIAAYLMARSWKQQDRLNSAHADLIEAERVRSLAEVEAALQRGLAAQSMRLNAAIENMPQGICMFDGDKRLIVCNQRYADLYGLSTEQTKPGSPFRSILAAQSTVVSVPDDSERYIARRLGDVSTKQPYQLINRLGDGRLISVTHRPMAGGGWIATHADVTEQISREELLRLLFEGSPVPMWVSDRETLHFLAVNDAALACYGYSRDQFMSMTVPDLRPQEDRDRFAEFLRSLHPVQFSENVGQHTTSDGRIIDVSVYSRALTYAGRNARLTVIYDISKSKRVENELRRTQKFLDAIVEHAPAPILVKEVTGAHKDVAQFRYTLINRAFEDLFGVSREGIVGKTVSELYPKERADFIIAENANALRSEDPITLFDHEVHTAKNGIRICTATTVAVRDDSNTPQYLVTLLQDVTERKRAERRIARMAHYDQLTDLANRRTFNDALETAIKSTSGYGDQFTVLSLDLDGFKEANDTHGHLIGDALLCEVSRRLMKVADGAFVARIGGDEFAVIVNGGMQIASPLAERLLSAFREEIRIEGRRMMTGATIGAAIFPNHGSDSKTLVSNADIALYRAKAKRRGSVLFFDADMGEEIRRRRGLQEALRMAVESEQLNLYYQPQKTISGETIGFEALARWQHSQYGRVPPATFIPIAEESGLIIPIGEWAVREACREAATWQVPLTVAVNISPLQFRYGDLPAFIHSVLLDTGLSPRRLELEITESVFIDDFSRAISILSRLKSLGVRIALDDFGSGFSSLSYLHSFAFDKIKIDRTFILDLEHNRHSMAIVRAVVDLGHSLNIPVLAEGVETAAQHAILLDRGCDEVQGYLLGRPMPIETYAELTGTAVIAHSASKMVS